MRRTVWLLGFLTILSITAADGAAAGRSQSDPPPGATQPADTAPTATPPRPLPPEAIPRLANFSGLGAMLDLSFAYYKNRSPRGLAKEIKAQGFTWVLVYGHTLTPEMAEALRAEGLALGLQLWGTIIYSPAGLNPPPPDSARQVFGDGPQTRGEQPVKFCPANEDFLAWYRGFAAEQVRRVPADLVLVIEAFTGSWGVGGRYYGCFCDVCLQRLKDRHPAATGFPEFEDSNSPRYYRADRELYNAWIDLRAEAHARFLTEAHAVIMREAPRVALAGSMLAIDFPRGIEKVREYNAQDLALTARAAPWDLFLLQAHWPDWTRPDLQPAEHVRSYRPFLDALRREIPGLRVGIVTDSGSEPSMRRSLAWLNSARMAALQEGFNTVSIYEYCISRFIYEQRPEVVEWSLRPASRELELVFSKRLDRAAATTLENYTLEDAKRPLSVDPDPADQSGGDSKPIHPAEVAFDGGNIVTLRFADWESGQPARLRIRNVLDDASTFWFNISRPWLGLAPANAVHPTAALEFQIP